MRCVTSLASPCREPTATIQCGVSFRPCRRGAGHRGYPRSGVFGLCCRSSRKKHHYLPSRSATSCGGIFEIGATRPNSTIVRRSEWGGRRAGRARLAGWQLASSAGRRLLADEVARRDEDLAGVPGDEAHIGRIVGACREPDGSGVESSERFPRGPLRSLGSVTTICLDGPSVKAPLSKRR